ncbi:terminase large subunit domain-containing protein [Streptomyces antibioticus]|uniref:terminase large subunit domain-containing protein n=1 Tax=Streptomyces antibioticus TaxID=1890 RepID=UPI0036F7286B
MSLLALAAAQLDEQTEELSVAELYAADPALWAREKLGEHLWSAQVAISESVRDHRQTAVQSCHGVGKSFMASRLTAWWLDTHPPGEARVVTTAPTGDQVKAILWSEINGAFAKAQARGRPFLGRINETDWKLDKRLIAFGRKPSDYNPHAFQGIHAKYVLVILDEACGINQQFWTAAKAIATGEHCRILAIGNPDDPGSQFARVCANDRWNTIRISAFDTPNFTGEAVPNDLLEMLVSQAYVEDMADEFGEESPTYISKVTGEFPSDSEDGVVRLSKVRACCRERQTPWRPEQLTRVELGVDLGAGGDETCIRERRGPVVGREWKFREKDPVKTVARILEAIRESQAEAVKVDVIGIGWGIVGSLREKRTQGLHAAQIVGVNVAEASSEPGRFKNLRSQIWWEIGRKLSEDLVWDMSGLEEADRERLVSQLTAPKYSVDSAGRTVVEPKAETRKRIGRSPDNADALLLAFYRPPQPVRKRVALRSVNPR